MEQIQQVLQQYEQALNVSDPTAAMALYSSEPIFMPQFASDQIGRDAVRATYEQIFKTIQLKVKFTIHTFIGLSAYWIHLAEFSEWKPLPK